MTRAGSMHPGGRFEALAGYCADIFLLNTLAPGVIPQICGDHGSLRRRRRILFHRRIMDFIFMVKDTSYHVRDGPGIGPYR